MNEVLVPVAVIGLLGLALQGTTGAIKLAREYRAERNGTQKEKPDVGTVIAVLGERLSAIDRRLTGVHDSVHDLRDGLQPFATQLALHEHRLKVLEDATK